jgi:hypothetical protein
MKSKAQQLAEIRAQIPPFKTADISLTITIEGGLIINERVFIPEKTAIEITRWLKDVYLPREEVQSVQTARCECCYNRKYTGFPSGKR